MLPAVAEGQEDDYNLGDVILGMSVICEEGESEGVRVEERLPVIFTHGLCHLLGYRHNTPTLAAMVGDHQFIQSLGYTSFLSVCLSLSLSLTHTHTFSLSLSCTHTHSLSLFSHTHTHSLSSLSHTLSLSLSRCTKERQFC